MRVIKVSNEQFRQITEALGVSGSESFAIETEEPLTQTDAAEIVLSEIGKPTNYNKIWSEIQNQKLWSPPNGGKTPEATLRSNLTKDKRFVHLPDGYFCLTEHAKEWIEDCQ